MGQYIQDGMRLMMETVIQVERPGAEADHRKDSEDLDGLNYLPARLLTM